jgi:ACR3 family arsenite efflux pump ArsB
LVAEFGRKQELRGECVAIESTKRLYKKKRYKKKLSLFAVCCFLLHLTVTQEVQGYSIDSKASEIYLVSGLQWLCFFFAFCEANEEFGST